MARGRLLTWAHRTARSCSARIFEKVEEAELNDGDEIALGNARFVFHFVEAAPAQG